MAKIFTSDAFVFEVAGLVPKLQATECVLLLRELQEDYFPKKDIKNLPWYVEISVDISNAAFAEMQKGTQECYFLARDECRGDKSATNAKALKNERELVFLAPKLFFFVEN